jgi:hypothetical protein
MPENLTRPQSLASLRLSRSMQASLCFAAVSDIGEFDQFSNQALVFCALQKSASMMLR